MFLIDVMYYVIINYVMYRFNLRFFPWPIGKISIFLLCSINVFLRNVKIVSIFLVAKLFSSHSLIPNYRFFRILKKIND